MDEGMESGVWRKWSVRGGGGGPSGGSYKEESRGQEEADTR